MHSLSHIPREITSDTKCIIMLHGVGSNERDLFSMNKKFSENVMVLSLRAPVTLSVGRYAWYPVDFSTGTPVYQSSDVELGYQNIKKYIEEIQTQHKISPKNTYLFGFSQGAIMSYYTLWRSPELLGGIVALSGRLLDEINTSDRDIDIYQDRRVFIGHGVHDQVIPVSASDPTSTFVRSLGIEPALHFYDIGHTISEDEISDIIVWLG